MKIYGKVNYPDQQIGGECPIGFTEMQSERPNGDWHALKSGEWLVGNPYTEDAFINIEMRVIAEQLLMHEDNDDSAIATESDWREYRKQLRKWNWEQNQHFPNPDYRPKRPD